MEMNFVNGIKNTISLLHAYGKRVTLCIVINKQSMQFKIHLFKKDINSKLQHVN